MGELDGKAAAACSTVGNLSTSLSYFCQVQAVDDHGVGRGDAQDAADFFQIGEAADQGADGGAVGVSQG